MERKKLSEEILEFIMENAAWIDCQQDCVFSGDPMWLDVTGTKDEIRISCSVRSPLKPEGD